MPLPGFLVAPLGGAVFSGIGIVVVNYLHQSANGV